MSKLRWRRIEPGYYELVGTDWTIANMKGQSVLWSGMISDPWVTRKGLQQMSQYPTKAAAQAAVMAVINRGDPS